MSKESAIKTVNEFKAKGQENTPWTQVNKTEFAQGIIDRLNSPDLVKQGDAPACGPAVFMHTLALTRPDIYAQSAINLYLHGRTQIEKLDVKPGADLMSAAPKTNAADWVMLASLRDSSNSFLSMGGLFGSGVAGITTPGDLNVWFRKAGYKQIINEANVNFSSKGSKNLGDLSANSKRASDKVDEGYAVALMIDSGLLKNEPEKKPNWNADHWVILDSRILNAGSFDFSQPTGFKVYTWGETREMPSDKTKEFKLELFLRFYFGYVAAKF